MLQRFHGILGVLGLASVGCSPDTTGFWTGELANREVLDTQNQVLLLDLRLEIEDDGGELAGDGTLFFVRDPYDVVLDGTRDGRELSLTLYAEDDPDQPSGWTLSADCSGTVKGEEIEGSCDAALEYGSGDALDFPDSALALERSGDSDPWDR